MITNHYFRLENKAGERSNVRLYISKGTTSLRRHLAKCHIEQWVKICDQRKIPITSETTKSQVDAYRERVGEAPKAAPTREYSKPLFTEALGKMLVAEDLVSVMIIGACSKLLLSLPIASQSLGGSYISVNV